MDIRDFNEALYASSNGVIVERRQSIVLPVLVFLVGVALLHHKVVASLKTCPQLLQITLILGLIVADAERQFILYIYLIVAIGAILLHNLPEEFSDPSLQGLVLQSFQMQYTQIPDIQEVQSPVYLPRLPK